MPSVRSFIRVPKALLSPCTPIRHMFLWDMPASYTRTQGQITSPSGDYRVDSTSTLPSAVGDRRDQLTMMQTRTGPQIEVLFFLKHRFCAIYLFEQRLKKRQLFPEGRKARFREFFGKVQSCRLQAHRAVQSSPQIQRCSMIHRYRSVQCDPGTDRGSCIADDLNSGCTGLCTNL